MGEFRRRGPFILMKPLHLASVTDFPKHPLVFDHLYYFSHEVIGSPFRIIGQIIG